MPNLLSVNAPTPRVLTVLTCSAIAGSATDVLTSMIIQRDLVAAVAATTQTVTAGKKLRVQSISVTVRNSSAVLQWARIALRANASGAVVAGSPIVWVGEVGAPGAVAGQAATMDVPFPDGVDLPAGAGFGVTNIVATTAALITVTVTGYEYVP